MENQFIPYETHREVGRGVALVFAPHPDDEVFGCAGAIMSHVANGDPVHVVIATDGGYDAGAPGSEEYVRTRAEESLRAAEVLGYGRPVFWNMKDRDLVYGEPLIWRITAAILEYAADFVYAPSLHEVHPDHRALAIAATEAARRLRGDLQLVMYEVGIPLTYPNLLLDISGLAERKKAAMACFGSQLQRQRYDEQINALNEYRSYTLPREIRSAEAYFVAGASALARDPLLLHKSEYQRQATLRVALDASDAPLVSVLIRSNGRAELTQALDSIALQTYANIEVLVVNASGRGHPELGDACGPFPLRFIDSDKPLRPGPAANRALEAASGKYMIFLDDDNWFLPDHVSTLAETLTRNPDKNVAYACVSCEDESKDSKDRLDMTYCHPFDRTRLLFGNFIPIHAALFSRAIVEGGCRMDETLEPYEDWDFWLQASALGDFAFVEHVSAAYRLGAPPGQDAHTDSQAAQQSSMALLTKWRAGWKPEELLSIKARVVEHDEQTRELIRLRQQLSRLQDQNSDLERQLSDSRQQNSDLAQQLSGLKQQHADLQQRQADLQQQHADLQQQNAQLQQQHADLQQQHADLQQQNAQLQQQHADLQQQHADLRQQNAQLQQQHSTLELQHAQLQQWLDVILHSRSWRITAPLRRIKDWLLGVR